MSKPPIKPTAPGLSKAAAAKPEPAAKPNAPADDDPEPQVTPVDEARETVLVPPTGVESGPVTQIEVPVNYDPETGTNPKSEDIGAVGKLDYPNA